MHVLVIPMKSPHFKLTDVARRVTVQTVSCELVTDRIGRLPDEDLCHGQPGQAHRNAAAPLVYAHLI